MPENNIFDNIWNNYLVQSRLIRLPVQLPNYQNGILGRPSRPVPAPSTSDVAYLFRITPTRFIFRPAAPAPLLCAPLRGRFTDSREPAAPRRPSPPVLR